MHDTRTCLSGREPAALPQAERAQELLGAQMALAVRHGGLLRAALAGAGDFRAARRYPARDVVDLAHGTRFFFHAHADGFASRGEYGHFHVFLDPTGKGSHMASHLIAVAIDGQGLPVRLFTVNRWVTGERWLPAPALSAAARDFRCTTAGRLAPVARWVSACVQAYAPVVDALLRDRDQRVARSRGAAASLETVFEDRSLEVLTECSVALVPPMHGGAISEEEGQ
ncbi:MAG: hypothetical protein KGI67_05705 [Pseudomonadota bacterium]|nr:hypothetical protein [Pseudomonadota bacterium]